MRFTERLARIVDTCRIDGINPFHLLIDMVDASFSGKHSIPDLCPLRGIESPGLSH